MMDRQVEQSQGMLGCIGQNADLKIGEPEHDILLRESELPFGSFDGNLGKGEGAEFAYGLFPAEGRHRLPGEVLRCANGPDERNRIEQEAHLSSALQGKRPLL